MVTAEKEKKCGFEECKPLSHNYAVFFVCFFLQEKSKTYLLDKEIFIIGNDDVANISISAKN